jgi:hypothetical protein
VAYPQTNTDNNSNEGLLRQLWHHVWAHYFKRLEQEEMRRLGYLRTLLRPHCPAAPATLPARLARPLAALLPDLSALLLPHHLTPLLQSLPLHRENGLWLKSLYLNCKMVSVAQWLGR